MNSPALFVLMYHYVRDAARTDFPRLKALPTDEFVRQIEFFRRGFEMATLETALGYLNGTYHPAKNLLLLTFDDGVKEHWSFVTPVLKEHGIQGLFFLITSLDLAPVHMNHFLMATLDFDSYRDQFLEAVSDSRDCFVDEKSACRQYPYDSTPEACFKYLINFVLPSSVRDAVLRELFSRNIGDPHTFARSLYLSWDEARQMQEAGMVIGGHSHWHRSLEEMSADELSSDLAPCREVLDQNLHPQQLWPFCYPYGKTQSFGKRSIGHLKRLGFHCSFTTEEGVNLSQADLFTLRRFDCKHAIRDLTPYAALESANSRVRTPDCSVRASCVRKSV
jgi:peptidoglycan/xylan/chitin deacetylase (PgdA/CDA1 family)